MKSLLPCLSLALMLLPTMGVAQNPCQTQSAKALQGFLANFNTTVEVGEFYSDCVKVPGGNPATLAIQSVEGEGTVAEMTIYASLEGPPATIPIEAGTSTPPIPLPPGEFGIELDLMAVGVIELAYTRPAGASGNLKTDFYTLNIVASAAFPVTWVQPLSYRQADGGKLLLEWSVAEQRDVAGYELEADTGDGFVSVADIAYREAGDGEVDYSTLQPWLTDGAYYRIKQHDHAGTSSYSNMLFVPGAELSSALTLFPNPATDFVRMAVPQQAASVDLYLPSGQHVARYSAAEARRGINLNVLPQGMYIVQAVNGDGVDSQRLVVQR